MLINKMLDLTLHCWDKQFMARVVWDSISTLVNISKSKTMAKTPLLPRGQWLPSRQALLLHLWEIHVTWRLCASKLTQLCRLLRDVITRTYLTRSAGLLRMREWPACGEALFQLWLALLLSTVLCLCPMTPSKTDLPPTTARVENKRSKSIHRWWLQSPSHLSPCHSTTLRPNSRSKRQWTECSHTRACRTASLRHLPRKAPPASGLDCQPTTSVWAPTQSSPCWLLRNTKRCSESARPEQIKPTENFLSNKNQFKTNIRQFQG